MAVGGRQLHICLCYVLSYLQIDAEARRAFVHAIRWGSEKFSGCGFCSKLHKFCLMFQVNKFMFPSGVI